MYETLSMIAHVSCRVKSLFSNKGCPKIKPTGVHHHSAGHLARRCTPNDVSEVQQLKPPVSGNNASSHDKFIITVRIITGRQKSGLLNLRPNSRHNSERHAQERQKKPGQFSSGTTPVRKKQKTKQLN